MKIDGKEIAQEILDNLKIRIEKLKEKNIIPNLAIILVGDDAASIAYTNQKKETLESLGGKAKIYKFGPSSTDEGIISLVNKIQKNSSLNGLLVQIPLPRKFNQEKILAAVDPKIDIDGFLPNSHFTPPIAKAVGKILTVIFQNLNTKNKKTNFIFNLFKINKNLDETNDFFNWLKTKNITIIGKGETAGKPIIDWLNTNRVEHKIVDSKTKNTDQILKSSDIIISAVGRENFQLKAEQVKDGVILIGIGLRKDQSGKFIGDYKTEEIKDKASFYTATLGGVGPVNVACLLENLVISTEQ